MKQKTILLTATLFILAACSQSEIETEEQAPKEIKATSVIEGAATRAIIDGDVALTGLTFLRKDVSVSTTDANTGGHTDFSNPTIYTGGSRAQGGAITFCSGDGATTPEYDKENKKSFFVGFTTEGKKAKEQQTENSNTAFVWTIDGKTDILLTDVWDAGTYENHSSLQEMKFQHKLSRLEVFCVAEDGSALEAVRAAWGNVTAIQVVSNVYPEMTYTYQNNTVSYTGTSGSFSLLDSYDNGSSTLNVTIHDKDYGKANRANGEQSPAPTPDAVAMIAPITATTGNPSSYSFQLKITTSGETGMAATKVDTESEIEQTVNVNLGSSNASMEAGKIHKVVLTFKADGRTISCESSSIEAWDTTGNSGTGEIVKPTQGSGSGA